MVLVRVVCPIQARLRPLRENRLFLEGLHHAIAVALLHLAHIRLHRRNRLIQRDAVRAGLLHQRAADEGEVRQVIHAQDKAGDARRVHVHGDFGVLGEFRAVQAKAGERRVQLIARINFPRAGGNKRLIDAPDIVFQHLNRRIPGQILSCGRRIPVNIARCPRDCAHEHRHQHQQRRAAQGFAHAHFFASSIACRSSTKRAMSSAVPSTPSLPVSTHRS